MLGLPRHKIFFLQILQGDLVQIMESFFEVPNVVKYNLMYGLVSVKQAKSMARCHLSNYYSYM
jgi:hypothetical protein